MAKEKQVKRNESPLGETFVFNPNDETFSIELASGKKTTWSFSNFNTLAREYHRVSSIKVPFAVHFWRKCYKGYSSKKNN